MLPYFKGYLQQILSKEDMVVTWRFGSTLWGIYIFTSFISAKQKDLHKVIQYFNYFFKCKSRIYMWKFFEISQPKISILDFLLKLIHVWSYGQASFSPTILRFKIQYAHVDTLFPPLAVERYFSSKGTFEDIAYIYTSLWIKRRYIQHEQKSILKRVWFEKFYTTFCLQVYKSVVCCFEPNLLRKLNSFLLIVIWFLMCEELSDCFITVVEWLA